MATQTWSLSGDVLCRTCGNWWRDTQPSVGFRALPQHLGKAAEHIFLQEETVLKDKDDPPPMPHRAPVSTPVLFIVVVSFGFCLLCHCQCVPSSNHNCTSKISPVTPLSHLEGQSKEGQRHFHGQNTYRQFSQKETPTMSRNQSRTKKIINFQSISTWVSVNSHSFYPEQPGKTTLALSTAKKIRKWKKQLKTDF